MEVDVRVCLETVHDQQYLLHMHYILLEYLAIFQGAFHNRDEHDLELVQESLDHGHIPILFGLVEGVYVLQGEGIAFQELDHVTDPLLQAYLV